MASVVLLVTVAEQVYLLSNNPEWGKWMIPLLVAPSALLVLLLIVAAAPDKAGTASFRFVPESLVYLYRSASCARHVYRPPAMDACSLP